MPPRQKPMRRTSLTANGDRTLATQARRRRSIQKTLCPPAVKAALVERDRTCRRCGTPIASIPHHIIRRPLPKAILWDLRLLALLCAPCHVWVHANVRDAQEMGLLVRRHSALGRALLAEVSG